MAARAQPRSGLGGFIRRHLGWDIGGAGDTGGTALDTPADGQLTGDVSWARGDLAECVMDWPWFFRTPFGLMRTDGPAKGDVFKVIGIDVGTEWSGARCVFLKFSAFEGRYQSTAFRKVIPAADKAERADPAFLEDLRRLAHETECARG